MNYLRRLTRVVKVGNLSVGGESPISIQSMTNTRTSDIDSTVSQIQRLQEEGCDIVRVAVPDDAAARALGAIKNLIDIPLVADIHFDYRLALVALDNGVDALRLNPGNIRDVDHIRQVVQAAKKTNTPIRIGVNAGSLEPAILQRHGGHPTAAAMVESALGHIKILESFDYFNIKISLKAHDVPKTIEAYRLMADTVNYPLHLGVTEAGTYNSGVVKSAVGIGTLLAEGIGDTLRVSLTADPIEEIKVGKQILQSLNLRIYGPTLVSCPTCGRCQINLLELAEKVQIKLSTMKKPITVAVMGCVVNGPGEAREADVGIAGGINEGILFRKGEIIAKVPEDKLAEVLFDELDRLNREE